MELKSVMVEVQGIGQVEIREPMFEDIEAFFDAEMDAKKFGLTVLKRCLYKDGELIFSKPVGAAAGVRLMALAPQVMELIGFNQTEEGKA